MKVSHAGRDDGKVPSGVEALGYTRDAYAPQSSEILNSRIQNNIGSNFLRGNLD